MSPLTYCKGLPTPAEELNSLGFTDLEMFLAAYAPVFHQAACETANHLLSDSEFNKSKWNSHLQLSYGISKRHAGGVISYAQGAVESAIKCRKNHVLQLQGKLKSVLNWIKKSEKKLKNAQKFYAKKDWQHSKAGCIFPLCSSLKLRSTNWQQLKFEVHNKKRKAYLLSQKISHLKTKAIIVKIPKNQVFFLGSKDEKCGNQVCQWDGSIVKIRVPACLERKFGKYVESAIGNFDRNINRLPSDGAKTWHFYRKSEKWKAGIAFTPSPVKRVSLHSTYGCIGIDLNPGSVGWAYIDRDGNLKAHGKIPLLMGLPNVLQQAQIVDACLQLGILAQTYACTVVCEELDFALKKEQFREGSTKYARMLSGWAYSRFYKLLDSILSNRGIYLMKVNPAYTSVIGLVKYVRQYGLSSDCAAAIAIARRGMRLTEKLPLSITAYLDVKSGKHVWSLWNQLNNLIKKSSIKRHNFYAISNWEFLVKQWSEKSDRSKCKH